MKLSIIIPVYNVEKYVLRCLDSCYRQDLPESDYEVICVDDGSTDNSSSLIETFAKKHNNIVVLHQSNAGQSAARNYGLKKAKGDYIWFIDSDDWIQPNVIKRLLIQAYQENLDTLCFTFQYVDENGEITNGKYEMPSFHNVTDGREFIFKYSMPAGPWSAIHRRDFLEKKQLYYLEGIKREDEDFTVRAYCSAERISYVNVVAYNYYQRNGSTMKSQKSVKTAYDLLFVADSLYKFAQGLKGNHQPAYLAVMNRVSFAFSQSLAYYEKNSINLNVYRKKPYYPLMLNQQLSVKDKLKYLLINFSLRLYLKIYSLR